MNFGRGDGDVRRIDSLVGSLVGGLGLGSAPSLAELLENSDFWGGETDGVEEDAIAEEMQLLKEGGPGAVREKRMQQSVQAWLQAKRIASSAAVRLRRFEDHAGHGGRAESLLEDSLNILERKTDLSENSAAACELFALKAKMEDRERELEQSQRRILALETALESERARITVSATAFSASLTNAALQKHPSHAATLAATAGNDGSAVPKGGECGGKHDTSLQHASNGAPRGAPPLPSSHLQETPETFDEIGGEEREIGGDEIGCIDMGRQEAQQVIANIRRGKLVDVKVPQHMMRAVDQMRQTIGLAVDRLALDLYSRCVAVDRLLFDCY